MNRVEEFKVENGIIQNSGKFEGECLYVPYFYGIMLDGEGETIKIDAKDRLLFPDIPEDKSYAVVIEDSQGFVTVEFTDNPDYYSDNYYDDFEIDY
jgi:hypothetical protein